MTPLTPETYDRKASAKGNESHKCSYDSDPKPRPLGLQRSTLNSQWPNNRLSETLQDTNNSDKLAILLKIGTRATLPLCSLIVK